MAGRHRSGMQAHVIAQVRKIRVQAEIVELPRCPGCGERMPEGPTGRTRKFCSARRKTRVRKMKERGEVGPYRPANESQGSRHSKKHGSQWR